MIGLPTKTIRQLFGLLLLALHSCGLWAAEDEDQYNALLIYGNGGIATWGQNFNEEFRMLLGPDLGQNFTPEFVALVNTDPDVFELVAHSLALKHSNTEIDLLIPVLPESNTFVHDWGHLFAPDASVLHVLPGDDVHPDPNSVGTREAVVYSAITTAVARTVEIMPVLLPDLETVYVVGGAGEGDQSYIQRYRNTINAMDSPLEFRFVTGMAPDELIDELQTASANSAVLMTTYDRDAQGRPFRTLIVTQQLSDSLDIPVFGNTDTLPRNGAIGGAITSARAYAAVAYDMTLQLMNGDFARDSSITGVDYVFNGAQLDRFDIDRNLLPANSEIILEADNIWREYGQWIVIATAIILVQLLLIGLLLESRRRRAMAEAELRKTQKMEALGALAGGIAHDFNNILMAISANTELAAMQAGDNKNVQDRLGRIQSASEKAGNLVSQILMFSRQSANQELKPVQLCSLMDESLDNIRSMFPDNCQIHFQCHAPQAIVRADSNQMHQVFMNLCVNAQHAMEGKGIVEVEASTVDLTEPKTLISQIIPPGEYALLTFRDNGSGISSEDLAHIFEPFYTTKPLGKGTGLGLALVYQIIKAHKGYIHAQSRAGDGTCIEVYLATESAEVKVDNTKLLSKLVKGTGEHILVVDDDEMVLDANSQALRNLGYNVTVYSSSVAALNYFRENSRKVDLLLTDLSMPEMDGVRLISNIQKIRPDIPVVLCSGYLEALESQELGNIPVMRKPFTVSELSEVLHKALNAIMAARDEEHV